MKKLIIALLIILFIISVFTGVYLIDKAFLPHNIDINQPVTNNQDNHQGFLADDLENLITVGIYNSGYLYHENMIRH